MTVSALLLGLPLAGVAGVLSSPGANAAPVSSSQGTDFWLSFENNDDGGSSLFLFISGSTATTGTVTDAAIAYSHNFTVTPGKVTSIEVPSSAEDDTSDSVVSDSAIHVTSGASVSAYGLNTKEYTTDGFLGLPTSILGTSYLAEGYGGGLGSQFDVVGTQNNTTVTITPDEDVDSYTAGTPYTEKLNEGDVYQLTDSSGGDLSGTTITSSAPVAVFAGNACADVPESAQYCNTITEEMTPTDTWGDDFLTEPLATRSGDTFRVIADTADTKVDINGSLVATLGNGQIYETILTSASSITANHPVQLMQYSNGETYDGANADPFDTTIPPTEQFLNNYTVTTEPNGADPAITQNYLNIVAPTSEVSSVDLDGKALPSSDFTAIPGSSYSGAKIAVAFGDHNVSASLPFGLTIYGYGGYDAYGYPGGFTLAPIAHVVKVSLAPVASTDSVGTSACETATVTDQFGHAVPGVRVDFTVTGVNPNAGFAYSAVNGTAQYCYTGTAVGGDSEHAAVGSITSNLASIKWTKVTSNLADIQAGVQGPASAADGSTFTEVFTTTNNGPATATGVATNSEIPPGLTVVTDSGATLESGTLVWKDASLVSGGSVTYDVTFKVGASVHSTTSLGEAAISSVTDPKITNNAAVTTIDLGS